MANSKKKSVWEVFCNLIDSVKVGSTVTLDGLVQSMQTNYTGSREVSRPMVQKYIYKRRKEFFTDLQKVSKEKGTITYIKIRKTNVVASIPKFSSDKKVENPAAPANIYTGFPHGSPVDTALNSVNLGYCTLMDSFGTVIRRATYLAADQNMTKREVIDCVGNSENLLTSMILFIKEVYGFDMAVVDKSKNTPVETVKTLLESLLAAL